MFAHRTRTLKSSFIRDILALTQRPDVISFAGGLPDPALFPARQLQACSEAIHCSLGAGLFQYGETAGLVALREWIGESLNRPRLPAEQILITTGAQQGLDLASRCLINTGDDVVIEAPSYVGALQVFRAAEAQLHEIPSDHEGPDLDQLEMLARQGKVKLFYTVTDFQNPTGVSYAESRRRALCELAEKYGFWILEDSPYSALRYKGTDLPTLQSLSPERVIQLGSFSKIIAPALRTGWISAPLPVIKSCERMKQVTDLHSSGYDQQLILEFLQRDELPAHLIKLRSAYGARLQRMTTLFEEQPGNLARVNRPQGGMFLWVRLNSGIDTMELFKQALQQKVAFVPGTAFYNEGGVSNEMRLNFSNSPEELIDEGVSRLLTLIYSQAA